MWRGRECEAAIGVVHPEQATLQIVPIHEDYVVVEVLHVYTVFVDELLQYPPNDEVTTLGQAVGQRLQWRRCRIHVKGTPTYKFHSHGMVQIPCSTGQVPSSHGSPPLPLLLLLVLKNLHPQTRKIQQRLFHSHLLLLLILKNRKTCIPTSARYIKYSIPTSYYSS
jgi:hypothetical protein